MLFERDETDCGLSMICFFFVCSLRVIIYFSMAKRNKARVKSYRVSCCRLQILLSVSTHGCSEPLQKITRIASQLLLWDAVRQCDVTTENTQ